MPGPFCLRRCSYSRQTTIEVSHGSRAKETAFDTGSGLQGGHVALRIFDVILAPFRTLHLQVLVALQRIGVSGLFPDNKLTLTGFSY